jgi:hypothetical protein
MIEPEEVTPVRPCALASAVTVEDTRTDATSGERSHEDKPAVKQAVTAVGDVAAWVRSGFEAIARIAVLRTSVANRPTITIRVAQLWIQEIVYKRAEYDGRMILDVVIRSADGSLVCLEGRFDGNAENYGYAGKRENYQETMNHALDQALAKALASPEVVDAICNCPPQD